MQTHPAIRSQVPHHVSESWMDGIERRMAAMIEQHKPKVSAQPSAAGQAATYHLAAHVLLINRCQQLGTRVQVFERDGFRHDAGPTGLSCRRSPHD